MAIRSLFTRRAGIILLVVLAAGVLTRMVGITLKEVAHGHFCDDFAEVLATDTRGYVVESKTSACTTLGTTVDGTIELTFPDGHRETVAKFLPWTGSWKKDSPQPTGPFDPTARWTSPRSLKVSLGVIDALTEKRTNVGGIDITYEAIEVDPSK